MFLDMFARFRKDRLNGCIEDLLVQLVERFSKHSDLFREFICWRKQSGSERQTVYGFVRRRAII